MSALFYFEKAAKAVRRGLLTATDAVTHGIVQAADNIAFLLDGLCRAPEQEEQPPFIVAAGVGSGGAGGAAAVNTASIIRDAVSGGYTLQTFDVKDFPAFGTVVRGKAASTPGNGGSTSFSPAGGFVCLAPPYECRGCATTGASACHWPKNSAVPPADAAPESEAQESSSAAGDVPPTTPAAHSTSALLRGAAADLSYYLEGYEPSVTSLINGRCFIKKLRDRADELDRSRQAVETGLDMGGRWAAETFPQHTKPQK